VEPVPESPAEVQKRREPGGSGPGVVSGPGVQQPALLPHKGLQLPVSKRQYWQVFSLIAPGPPVLARTFTTE